MFNVKARRRVACAVLWVITLIGSLTGSAVPASAFIGSDANCPDELEFGDEMRTVRCGSWRWDYVYDPGENNFVTYQDLWRVHTRYNSVGFPDSFLWYSPITDRTFHDATDGHVTWAHCAPPPGDTYGVHEFPRINDGRASGVCVDRVETGRSVTAAFVGNTVTLPMFAFGNAFIALACGNFSTAPSTSDIPVPTVTGHKYHDNDRNGVRGPADEGLGDWRIRLVRDSSALNPPQATGLVAETLTAPDGSYEFRLDTHGPGTYHVEEEGREGWVQTAAPGPFAVDFGGGNRQYHGGDLGNVEDRADVVKVAWQVIDPPSSMHARQAEVLRVRATIGNLGPAASIDVVDEVTASGQDDCVFQPAAQSATRTVAVNTSVIVDFEFTVTCALPSFHRFVFDDRLRILTPGVTDPDETNNTRIAEVVIPVIDDADIGLSTPTLDCPSRIDVATAFECVAAVDVTNDGPYTPANVDVGFDLTVPSDCTAATSTSQGVDDVRAVTGSPTRVSRSWSVSCATRSFHPVGVDMHVALDHLHLQDLEDANDVASADDLVEVFEAADLSIVQPMRIACGGRLPTITAFSCDIGVTVLNGGPADAVQTSTTNTLGLPTDCVAAPSGSQVQSTTLDSGAQTTLVFHWDVTCTDQVLHTVLATATVRIAEPHAEDRALENNDARVRWIPTDVKPGSDPSSVNVSKEGIVPVAILSTPEFDALTEVVRSSVRFGATGFEPSLVGCGADAEDRNGDGFDDLVCRFTVALTGLTCSSTTAYTTGLLVDGTPFESQDPVNTVGCPK